MSAPTVMIHGKEKECPKCHSKDIEAYMTAGGTEQMCPDCGWTSEEKFDYEVILS